MKKWLQRRRDRQISQSYRCGFEWAASSLLLGEETVDSIEALTTWNGPWPHYLSAAFNQGASEAVTRLRKLAPGQFPSSDDCLDETPKESDLAKAIKKARGGGAPPILQRGFA